MVHENLSDLTGTDAFLGTIPYMAPELLRPGGAREGDARGDIWALGVTLQELLTGERPFRGDHVFGLIAAIQDEPPAPLPAGRDWPDALAAVLTQTLAKDPGQRFQSMHDLGAALRELVEDGGPWPSPSDGTAVDPLAQTRISDDTEAASAGPGRSPSLRANTSGAIDEHDDTPDEDDGPPPRDVVLGLRDHTLVRTLHVDTFIVRHTRSGELREAVVTRVPARLRARAHERAHLLCTLSHPAIVSTHDVVEYSHGLVLVRSRARGQPLHERIGLGQPLLTDGALGPAFALLADALAEAHRVGVIHGYLTPECLHIDGEAIEAAFPILPYSAYLLHGTPAYEPPEFLNWDSSADEQPFPLDGRSDLYSFGVILFEAATGRRPFHTAAIVEFVQHVLSSPAPSPRQFRASVPRAVEDVCLRCVRPRVDERPATAGDVAALLRASEDHPPGFWRRLFGRRS